MSHVRSAYFSTERIPQALKELDQTLKEIQVYIRSGGETTAAPRSMSSAAAQRLLGVAKMVGQLKAAHEAAKSLFDAAPKQQAPLLKANAARMLAI